MVFFLSFNSIQANNWLTSFDEGQKIALATDKLLLVDFWASWCGPCKRMDSESWSKDDVKVLMDNYVPVQIDIDRQKELATKYNVRGIPYIFIMDGNGQVIYQEMSYKRKDEVIEMLKKYALNTSFLRQDLINYFKKPDFATSFRLAAKYQDYSLHLDDNIKRNFLQVSRKYFDEASSFLKKSNLGNKEMFEKKMELYSIQEQLILNKSKKALKMLGKINSDTLEEANISMFNFLNYIVHKQIEDEENANLWFRKMTDMDKQKSNLYLKTS